MLCIFGQYWYYFSDNILKTQYLFIFWLLTVFLCDEFFNYRLQDIMLIGIDIFRIGLLPIHELEF